MKPYSQWNHDGRNARKNVFLQVLWVERSQRFAVAGLSWEKLLEKSARCRSESSIL
jgi:hypothetical protein